MTAEEQRAFSLRLGELIAIAGDKTTAATILLLTDRLVVALSDIESGLSDINESLEKIWKGMPEP